MRKILTTTGFSLTLFLFCAGVAVGAASHEESKSPAEATAASPAPDHAGSYYHFMLARRYEELAGIYNRSDYVQRAISEYKQAIADDPASLFLHIQLGDLYWRVGQVGDGVQEAKYVLKRNPDDLEAHRLLATIYLHDLSGAEGQAEQKLTLERAIQEYEAITRLAPSDTRSAVLLARLYALDNQSAKSEALFEKILSTHPDSISALTNLGRVYIDHEEYKQAIAFFEKIPAGQRGPGIAAMLGFAYSQTGDYEKAAQNFRSAVDADPQNIDIRRQYADALMRSGKLDAAKAQFETILKEHSQDGLSHLRLAQIAQAQGRFPEATQLLAEAAKLLPTDMRVTYQQALLDAAIGNNASAIQILNGLLEHTKSANGKYTSAAASNRAVFLKQLGAIYRSQGKYDQALAAYREVVTLGPDQAPRGEELIVETLDLAGRRAQAIEEANQAINKYPNDRSLRLERASLLGEQGHVNEAIGQLRDLLVKKSGNDVRVELAIVQVYSRAKQYRKAQAELNSVLQQDLKPDDREFAQFLLGSVYERQKKYDLAEKEFKKVLATDPLNAEAFNYLGYMLADRGVQLQESVKYIQKALQLDPSNGAYLDSLGWAYFKMARYNMARAPLEKAAKLLSNDPTVLDHLGQLYVKLGLPRQAAQEWQRALKNWPNSNDSDFDAARAAKLQKRLSQLERHLSKDQKM